MGQVTIYLNDETEKKMQLAAEAMKISKSKWISQIIEERVRTEWPLSIREMAGSWKDFPEIEELRSSLGKDIHREEF